MPADLPRHLALGLQYAYTNGGCATFAAAAMTLPSCAGARAVSVDEGERDHLFLLLPDGSALDAEGVRPLAALLRDFGMPPGIAMTDAGIEGIAGEHVDALLAHLLEMGWGDALPDQDRDSCATTRFLSAERDFETLGGWCGKPLDALSAAAARCREAA